MQAWLSSTLRSPSIPHWWLWIWETACWVMKASTSSVDSCHLTGLSLVSTRAVGFMGASGDLHGADRHGHKSSALGEAGSIAWAEGLIFQTQVKQKSQVMEEQFPWAFCYRVSCRQLVAQRPTGCFWFMTGVLETGGGDSLGFSFIILH